jgi:hypothetical protein
VCILYITAIKFIKTTFHITQSFLGILSNTSIEKETYHLSEVITQSHNKVSSYCEVGSSSVQQAYLVVAVLYLYPYPYPYHDHPLQYPEPGPLTGWLRKGHLDEEELVLDHLTGWWLRLGQLTGSLRVDQLTVWVRMG